MTIQARSKLVTLQTGNVSYTSQALPIGSAKGFLRVLGTVAVIFAVALAASMSLDTSQPNLPTVSGYLWDDRDDATTGTNSVAGYLWEDRDGETTGTDAYAGFVWEDRDGETDGGDNVAGFVWEDRDGTGSGGNSAVAGLFWHESTPSSEHIAGLFWHEAQISDSSVAGLFWHEAEAANLAGLFWHEAQPTESAVAGLFWHEVHADKDHDDYVKNLLAGFVWEDRDDTGGTTTAIV